MYNIPNLRQAYSISRYGLLTSKSQNMYFDKSFTYFSIKIQQIKCINTDLNFNLRGISILLEEKKKRITWNINAI